MSTHDRTFCLTQALNQSGSFLQIHVMNELEKLGWKINSEIPVECAPFIDDPLTNNRFFDQGQITKPLFTPKNFTLAVSESQNKIELEETSVDIVASNEGTEYSFKLCIECKKLNPDYSDWIFFRKKQSKHQMNVITKSITSLGFVQLFKVLGNTRCSNEIHIELSNFKF